MNNFNWFPVLLKWNIRQSKKNQSRLSLKRFWYFLLLTSGLFPSCDLEEIPDAITSSNTLAACFSADPQSCKVGCTITFNASCSGTVDGYSWSIMDANGTATDQGQTITYKFQNAGTFKVTLTVTKGNLSDSTTENIVIEPLDAPEACFEIVSVSNDTIISSEVCFNGSCSMIYTKLEWDFDNDGTIDDTGDEVCYTYESPALYTVKLYAENANGDIDSSSQTINIKAPVVTFEKYASIGSVGNERVYDLTIDSEGNYVVCGSTMSFSEQVPAAFKVLRNGAVNWDKTLIPSGFEPSALTTVIESEGEYLFSGTGWLEAPSFKTDLFGNIINGSLVDFPYAAVYDPKLSSDNLIIYHSYLNAFCIPFCWEPIIFADRSGNNFTPPDINQFDFPFHRIEDIEILSSDELMICGWSFERVEGSSFSYDSTIVSFAKLDPTQGYGNVFVNTEYNHPDSEQEVGIDAAIDKNGNSYHLIYAPDSEQSISLVKLDKEGNFVFPERHKSYSVNGFDIDIPVSIDVTLEGNIIITGHTRSFSSNYKIFLLKLDSDGNPIWSPSFKLYGDNNKQNIATKVLTDPIDGGFVVAGTRGIGGFDVDLTSLGDFYLLKTDKDGNL